MRASGLLRRKASAAGPSYSMAHLVTAAPARCSPSLSPPHPAKMSMVASDRPSAGRSAVLAAAAPLRASRAQQERVGQGEEQGA